LSALTGACSAPLTVLHPALASGMFSAATELWLRRPRVADMEALRHDLSRWPGWWRNRVSRTLLVFFFTNLGTAFGAWTSGFEIVRRLS
jgi:pheromone shutdown protein TraB